MSDKLKIGFVGAGFMGQKAHLDNFVTIPECEIVALAEGREETARLVADRYGIPKVYPHHREMLAGQELDAAIAIMPYTLHASVVPDILQAGVSVLTEKPMCMRPASGERMSRIAEDQGVIYYVGYMKRSAPAAQRAVETIREWQDSGEFGRLRYLRAAMPPGDWLFDIEEPLSAGDQPPSYEGVSGEPPPDWMSEEVAADYNSFINYYIHQVNLIRYLLGEDYRVTYADETQTVLAGESDSGVSIILEMQGYGLSTGWEETYRLLFDQGKIELSIPSPMARQRGGQLSVFRGGEVQSTEQPHIAPIWPFLAQARHFVRCVQGLEDARVTPQDAVKDLRVAEQYARALAGFGGE